MTNGSTHWSYASPLVGADAARRERAEALSQESAVWSSEQLAPMSADATRQMLHELHVHQIELEMQNEELRRAQLELGVSQEQYFDLYELAPVGYCTISDAGRILQANLTATVLLGVSRSDLIARPITNFVVQADQDIFYFLCRQLIATGKASSQELRMTTGSGAVFWAHLKATVSEERAGTPTIRLTLTDITEHMNASAAQLLLSEQRYHTLVEWSHDAIVVHREGKVLYLNSAALQMLGASGIHELVGKPVMERVHEEDRQLALSWAKDLSSEALVSSSPVEQRLLRLDGRTVFAEVRSTLIPYDGQSTVLTSMRDLTERKRTETLLVLSDRLASVGLLAAGVAHEINNPLAAVIGNIRLAQQDVVNAGAPSKVLQDRLGDAFDGAERIRVIVRDLRMFSSPEQAALGPVDTEQVLDSTLRMAGNELRHRARVIKDYAGLAPIEANESRIGQLFLNLIVNAAQAIPEGRADVNEVRVSTRLDADDYVVIEIEDTGSGMSEEVRQQLFSPFFTTKPMGMGMGLGLSICQRITADLGGRIEVESELGRGSLFRVYLRKADTTAAPRPARASAESVRPVPVAQRRGKILLIDDEPALCALIHAVLVLEHEVVTETRPRAALARVAAGERFDVILCDLMMPEMTGVELFEELERAAPDQAERCVFISGGAFTLGAREFLDRVPNTRLEKPFRVETLRALVNQRVGLPSPPY